MSTEHMTNGIDVNGIHGVSLVPEDEGHETPINDDIPTKAADSQMELNEDGFVGFSPKITVIGVGGGGGNAINHMIEAGLMSEGVNFVACNTDAQALSGSKAQTRIQLGAEVTRGLGAGSRPSVGKDAAADSSDAIRQAIKDSNIVFITAGMGGGTGTGAAPVIAQIAKEETILTVAVVTRPFDWEGKNRARNADEGLKELIQHVDTLLVIPNQAIMGQIDKNTYAEDAFALPNNILLSGVRGVTDLMIRPGIINCDFADIGVVMGEGGQAIMGSGEASGDNRATSAAEDAIRNPLLEHACITGATAILVNITGSNDLTMVEIQQVITLITAEADEEANIIFGTANDQDLGDKIRVSIVATGLPDHGGINNQGSLQDNHTGLINEQHQELAEDSHARYYDETEAKPEGIFGRFRRGKNKEHAQRREEPRLHVSRAPSQATTSQQMGANNGNSRADLPAFMRRGD